MNANIFSTWYDSFSAYCTLKPAGGLSFSRAPFPLKRYFGGVLWTYVEIVAIMVAPSLDNM